MELRADPVALPYDCGDLAAVSGRRNCRRACVASKAMSEIDIVAVGHSKIGRFHSNLCPAHVRHRPSWCSLQGAHPPRNEAETGGALLLIARIEQQLHSKADAECRLTKAGERPPQPKHVDPLHREAGSAHARKDDPVGACDFRRIRSHERLETKAAESEAHGPGIAAAKVNDDELHNRPLVLGNASGSPSGRTAWRRARPNALKQAS